MCCFRKLSAHFDNTEREGENSSQKLPRSVLQPNEKVQYDAEQHQRDKGNGDIHERHRKRLNEGMIHCRSEVPKDNRPLGEQSRDFGDSCER